MPRAEASAAEELRITPITAAQTLPLRQSVLRAGLPPQSCVFNGDEAPTTTHLGAWRGEKLIGIATLMQQPLPAVPEERASGAGGGAADASQPRERASTPPCPTEADHAGPAVRLRGMAVSPRSRGRGVGAFLLRACFDHARQAGASIFWCHARTPAVCFYQRYGMHAVGEVFDIPTAGPHRLMWCRLAPETDSPG